MLANEATTMLHGAEAAAEAAETARRTFEEGELGDALPRFTVDLDAGIGLLQALVLAGFASSNSEARRSVQGGAVRVNDEVVKDERMQLTRAHLKNGSIKLSMGRKKHALLVAI